MLKVLDDLVYTDDVTKMRIMGRVYWLMGGGGGMEPRDEVELRYNVPGYTRGRCYGFFRLRPFVNLGQSGDQHVACQSQVHQCSTW